MESKPDVNNPEEGQQETADDYTIDGNNGLKRYTKEYIEKQTGSYDDDGFYLLQEGDYFDTFGFYFDVEGFDEIGGFYDQNTGAYKAPPAEYGNEDDYVNEASGNQG